MVQYDISIHRVQVPPAAIEYAHRLAQHGVPVRALVRAYHLGQGTLLQRSFEVPELQVSDPELTSLAAQRLTAITLSYIDWVTEHILEVYEDERTGGCGNATRPERRASGSCFEKGGLTSETPRPLSAIKSSQDGTSAWSSGRPRKSGTAWVAPAWPASPVSLPNGWAARRARCSCPMTR